MIDEITLTDFLSFGPGAHTLKLQSLNVLIGPNGSGKSNLIEAFSVLRAVPKDLPLPIRQGGGVDEWIWRGGAHEQADSAAIEIVFVPKEIASRAVRYRVAFGSEGGTFVVLDERIENRDGSPKPYFYFGYENGRPMLNSAKTKTKTRALERADIDRTQSILSQRRDPENYPEVAATGDRLKQILIYRAWSFGPQSAIRAACGADVQTDRLLEDFSNLPARLAVLKRTPATKKRLLELLSEVAPGFTDVEVIPEGGQLRLYLTEGERNVPAHRLSDGTLRFLSLLAILLDPGPARLVLIEEPELGLHPDVLPALRDLLVEASSRFQLVVTTHSTQLVDAMTEHAAAVVVCEKDGSTSKMTRLDADKIARWKEFGSLGPLWLSGRIGGTRW
ncbi:AAA family ATPase [Sorangium sp. So ce513]|uniref:AAA family ATPase n=1 Tax=Sorangium sp. So ce513 TaxID=3133315 RepID=UPI003F641073